MADFVTAQNKSNIGQALNNLVKFYVLLTMHLYINLVNETNSVHDLKCILSIIFITSTCFGPLQVHHQEGDNCIYAALGTVILYS